MVIIIDIVLNTPNTVLVLRFGKIIITVQLPFLSISVRVHLTMSCGMARNTLNYLHPMKISFMHGDIKK